MRTLPRLVSFALIVAIVVTSLGSAPLRRAWPDEVKPPQAPSSLQDLLRDPLRPIDAATPAQTNAIRANVTTPGAAALQPDRSTNPDRSTRSSLTSAYVKDVDLGNGRHQAVISSEPINYRAADGSWQPIDPRFAAAEGGFVNARNSFEIAASNRRAIVRVSTGAYGIGWEPQSLVLADNTQEPQVLATTLTIDQALTGTLSNDARTITYTHGWTSADLIETITSGPGSVEHNVIVARPPSSPSPLRERGELSLRAMLHLLPGLQIYADGQPQTNDFTTDGAIEVRDMQGNIVVELPPARVFERDDPQVSVAAQYRVQLQTAGEWQISIETPWAWWADRARHYPVVIDPIIQIVRWTAIGQATYAPCTYVFPIQGARPLEADQVGLGSLFACGAQRALVRFDNVNTNLPTLPVGAVIQKAELLAAATGGYFADFSGTTLPASAEVRAHRVTSAWNAGDVPWGSYTTDANPLPPGNSGVNDPNAALFVVLPPPQNSSHLYGLSRWTLQNGSTGMVSDWLNGLNNYGVELRLSPNDEKLNCTNLLSLGQCRHYVTFPKTAAWSTNDKDFGFDAVVERGGFMLVITYQGPTLPDGVPQSYTNPSQPPTAEGDDYYRTQHTYALPAYNGSRWTAIGVKGLRTTQVGTNTLLLAEGNVPIGSGCTGEGVACSATNSTGDYAKQSNFVVIKGNTTGRDARIYPSQPPDPAMQQYVVEMARSTPLPELPGENFDGAVISGTGVLTINVALSSTHVITGFDLHLYDNTRVGIKVTSHVGNFASNVVAHAFKPSSVTDGFPLPKDAQHKIVKSGTTQRLTLNNGDGGWWGFLLEYPGDVTVKTCDGQCFEPAVISVTVVIRGCPLNAIPTEDGCEFMVKPHVTGAITDTQFVDVGPYRIYSEGGFQTPCSDGSGLNCTNKVAGGKKYTPFITWGGTTDRMVAIAQGAVHYQTPNTLQGTFGSQNGSIVLMTIDPPQGITQTLELWTGDFDGFDASWANYLVKANPAACSNDCADQLPLYDGDAKNVSLRVNMPQNAISTQHVEGAATFDRGLETYAGLVVTPTFTVQWWAYAEGYQGHDGYLPPADPNLIGPAHVSIGYGGGQLQADMASLTVQFDPAQWTTMDYDPYFGKFTNLRNFGKIAQDIKLGGAWLPIQALVLGPGKGVNGNVCKSLSGFCLDLRALDDTFAQPNPNWKMPDVTVSNYAKTMMVSQAGRLTVWSADHPSIVNTQLISESFSFNGMDGTVHVDYDVCPIGAVQDKTLVVKGNAKMTLPGMGDPKDPSMVISGTFTLCETKLRQVGMYFHAEPGLPVGNSGMFVSGVGGTITIDPDYTEVKATIDFAYGVGKPKIIDASATVTIDTRGLFDLQAEGRVLAVVDLEGHLWVAWNPLDTGIDVSVYFPKKKDDNGKDAWWIFGRARFHLWEGQGWQHKYKWLPDNGDMHFAGSIEAKIDIKQGQIGKFWYIDLPPFRVTYGITVEFGEFCKNSSCTQYEGGIKGKLTVLDFDVGLYVGFQTGVSFILGSDGHVLIDQYGGSQRRPDRSDGPIDMPLVNGQPVAFDRRVVPNAAAAVFTQPITITANTGSFLAALSWARNAPRLSLVRPDSIEISTTNAITYGVQYSLTANSVLYGVANPMPGLWTAKISNATSTDDYHFVFFANKKAPTTSLLAPTPGTIVTATIDSTQPITYRVQWTPIVTPDLKLTLFYSSTNAGALTPTQEYGGLIGRDIPASQGYYDWDLSYLGQGRYYVYGYLATGRDVRPTITGTNQIPGFAQLTAPGTLVYLDSIAPPQPNNLTITPLDNAALACWDSNPAHDVSGYLLDYVWPDINGIYQSHEWRVLATAEYTPTAAPPRQCERINGLNNGGVLQLTVASYDASGNLSTPRFGEDLLPSGSATYASPAANLTGTVQAGYTVVVSWTAIAGSTSLYRLYYSRDLPAGPGQPDSSASEGPSPIDLGPVTNMTLHGLTHGAWYDFMVQSYESDGRLGPRTDHLRLLLTNHVDGNGDGLPDDWQSAYNASDPNADPDRDGLTNRQEYQRGANPQDRDSDGDGFSDGEEVAAGTDSMNGQSVPAGINLPTPRLYRTPDFLYYDAFVNGGNPNSQLIDVGNIGGGVMTPTVSASAAWIKPQVIDGNVRVSIDKTGLTAGQYTGVVTITAVPTNTQDSPQTVTIGLWLSAGTPPIGYYKVYLPLVAKQ